MKQLEHAPDARPLALASIGLRGDAGESAALEEHKPEARNAADDAVTRAYRYVQRAAGHRVSHPATVSSGVIHSHKITP